MIFLLHIALSISSPALRPVLFMSYRVAGMTADLPSPHRPVRLLTRSQTSTFHVSLARVFPSCFRSSSLPFPWSSTLSSECVLRLSSSHARTSSIASAIFSVLSLFPFYFYFIHCSMCVLHSCLTKCCMCVMYALLTYG